MEERLGRLLALTGKVARERFDEQLTEVGSSLNTYLILKHALYYEGVSQRQLAGGLGIEGPTLTHHLDRLAAEGLARRVRDPVDRRVSRVELTAEGKAHLDRVEAYANKADVEFRSLFTKRELDTLVELLNRIRDHYTKEAHVHHAAG
jgi:MarR family transcriptional regulator, transcriptional regulator for hemolysin